MTLDILMDTILPGDPEFGLPAGSQVDILRYATEHGIESQFYDFIALLDDVALDVAGMDFQALAPTQRLDCVGRSLRKHFQTAGAIIVHCLKAYYTNPEVLRRVSAGAVPPFPEGNLLDEDDWTILEPVYERGTIFRSVGK